MSRGGLKLAAALDAFGVDVSGYTCADLGCNVGGFTDCLLQRGAAKVYAVDTGYGELAWKLRNDARVVVLERTNALHADVPAILRGEHNPKQTRMPPGPTPTSGGGVDLVVIDLAWTKQEYAIPAALRWRPRWIISLIKPHYEGSPAGGRGGVLKPEESEEVFKRVLEGMAGLGVEVVGQIKSPILGGGVKKRGTGNVEYLALLRPGAFPVHQ